MSYPKEFQEHLQERIKHIKEEGCYKNERIILSPQGAEIRVKCGKKINLCANNYLGLANSPKLIFEAIFALIKYGFGLSSVRFICGTQDIHKKLEQKLSNFLGTEDTILYSSCAAANEGLFEVILNSFEDVVISDRLNHATIIDGERLRRIIHKIKLDGNVKDILEDLEQFTKPSTELSNWYQGSIKEDLTELLPKPVGEEFKKKLNCLIEKVGVLEGAIKLPGSKVFKHSDMEDLKRCLKETQNKRFRLICTDGVFSMDGDIAKLDEICDLAERYNAMVMVDDSHATGFVGKTGRGSIEYRNVIGRVDIITSTFGKALGGALGGFTSGHEEIIEILRQESRPYLFSNTLTPVIVAPSLKVLGMLGGATKLIDKLNKNTRYFRKEIKGLGFEIVPGIHPIVPIMIYEAMPTKELADGLLKEGIYVTPFSYPVVPKGAARIRVQISAAHSQENLDFAIEKFGKVGRELKII